MKLYSTRWQLWQAINEIYNTQIADYVKLMLCPFSSTGHYPNCSGFGFSCLHSVLSCVQGIHLWPHLPRWLCVQGKWLFTVLVISFYVYGLPYIRLLKNTVVFNVLYDAMICFNTSFDVFISSRCLINLAY